MSSVKEAQSEDFTVQMAAISVAAWFNPQKPNEQSDVYANRLRPIAYDHQVSAFNYSTIALVASFALAFFGTVTVPAGCMLAAASYFVRSSVQENLHAFRRLKPGDYDSLKTAVNQTANLKGDQIREPDVGEIVCHNNGFEMDKDTLKWRVFSRILFGHEISLNYLPDNGDAPAEGIPAKAAGALAWLKGRFA